MIQSNMHRNSRSLLHSFLSRNESFSSISKAPPFFPLQVQPVVAQALERGRAVVALESTIVAHGMPYPENLQLALEVEDILRSRDVTPATIALKDGVCRIGLDREELTDLAKAGEDGRAQKCSTRDLPIQIAMTGSTENARRPQWGATTVASTMHLAHLAGITTFATGGIGGVHRDGENSMDISADLLELSRTPVIVVSAGIKSILDIARTMEVLETQSVPTLGWQTNEFPAFFSPESGVYCLRVDDAAMVSRIFLASRALKLDQGMLVAVPNHDPAGTVVENAIQDALNEAKEKNISGPSVTPYVLKAVAEKTNGDSLRSNMALVRRNAAIAADIAIAIAQASN
jgi:pseudouridylate synthase